MHDMRNTEEEKKDFCTPRAEAPTYPYGTQISINSDQYEKFAFQAVPKVGDEFKLLANVKVKSVSLNDEGKPQFELQIVEMDLKQDKPATPSNGANLIYGA